MCDICTAQRLCWSEDETPLFQWNQNSGNSWTFFSGFKLWLLTVRIRHLAKFGIYIFSVTNLRFFVKHLPESVRFHTVNQQRRCRSILVDDLLVLLVFCNIRINDQVLKGGGGGGTLVCFGSDPVATKAVIRVSWPQPAASCPLWPLHSNESF